MQAKKPSQKDRFEKAARELGADQDEEAFDQALRKMRVDPPGIPDDGHNAQGD